MSVDPRQWLLTRAERDNAATRLDDLCDEDRAWSEGNLVTPLIDGVDYFADLLKVLEATQAGDLVLFTDWQGNADQLLGTNPDRTVLDVLGEADERGVDVRGLVWRSHLDQAGFFASQNRHLGEQLQRRGAEVLLDMRVRTGGSHHQKFVVVRHQDDPQRDVAWVGGIDLAHSRRDTSEHLGDPQADEMAEEYGDRPPWHDVQVRIQGPAVHAVETVFRERWEDPAPLARIPTRRIHDKLRGNDTAPDPLPPQLPPPAARGHHPVQLLRTYPKLPRRRDYPFAPGGERSVARGYSKALHQARRLVYVEDQYFWGEGITEPFLEALERHRELRLVVVIPLHSDVEGPLSRDPELVGRNRAFEQLMAVAPGRVALYGLENEASTPIYVHAKVCVVDDLWASVGSDNFNRRSWTHDSELTAAVLDADFARDLRLRLAAEHLGRLGSLGDSNLHEVMSDCADPHDMYDAYERCAAALEAWHDGDRRGPRPPGRLRVLPLEAPTGIARALARIPLGLLHDPDGRPRGLRGTSKY